MKNDVEDIVGYFSAYVKKSIKNTRWHYLNKKFKINSNEALCEDMAKMVENNLENTHRQIEILSEQLVKGILEIKLLLDEVEDYTIFTAISALPDKHKRIIVLRILYEKSFVEIGHIMGVSDKKAENTYYNIIKKVRRIIGGTKDEL
ncbi:sigma-70 family RNA polymerase sigma factor [Blautia pseudococcoides]|nr:sigma-70 family RNA polymerase sigma factor [Blautia pseudococcoides]